MLNILSPAAEARREAVAAADFDAGYAAGMLVKTAGDAVPAVVLTGRLVLSPSGWLLLEVPNALVRGLFQALDVPGAELPPGKPAFNAHISVARPEELEKIPGGPEAVTERGKRFRWQIGPIKEVAPAGWSEMSRVWFASVESPELKALRRSYGLSALPQRNGQTLPFHLSLAVRRKNVLRENDVAKAAEHTHTLPDGRVIDIDRLIARLNGRPTIDVPLSGLKIDRSSRTGFSKRRYAATDVSYPGIVDESTTLLDGRHRAARLIDAGETSGRFRVATSDDVASVMKTAASATFNRYARHEPVCPHCGEEMGEKAIVPDYNRETGRMGRGFRHRGPCYDKGPFDVEWPQDGRAEKGAGAGRASGPVGLREARELHAGVLRVPDDRVPVSGLAAAARPAREADGGGDADRRPFRPRSERRGPEGEYCPHCDARLERDPDSGRCNRCGKKHPLKKSAAPWAALFA